MIIKVAERKHERVLSGDTILYYILVNFVINVRSIRLLYGIKKYYVHNVRISQIDLLD